MLNVSLVEWRSNYILKGITETSSWNNIFQDHVLKWKPQSSDTSSD